MGIQCFFNIYFRLLAARHFFFACPKNEVPKKKRHPRYSALRIPSQFHDFLRSRKQDFLSWFRLFERPVQITLKSFTYSARYEGVTPFVHR